MVCLRSLFEHATEKLTRNFFERIRKMGPGRPGRANLRAERNVGNRRNAGDTTSEVFGAGTSMDREYIF